MLMSWSGRAAGGVGLALRGETSTEAVDWYTGVWRNDQKAAAATASRGIRTSSGHWRRRVVR
jgi:hypothetical protein